MHRLWRRHLGELCRARVSRQSKKRGPGGRQCKSVWRRPPAETRQAFRASRAQPAARLRPRRYHPVAQFGRVYREIECDPTAERFRPGAGFAARARADWEARCDEQHVAAAKDIGAIAGNAASRDRCEVAARLFR